MWIVWCVIALILAYIVLILAPAFFMFHDVYGHQTYKRLDEKSARGSSYEPFIPRIEEAAAWFYGLMPQEVYANAKDGSKLSGLYVPGKSTRVALLVHGYRAEPVKQFGILAKELYSKDYGILIIRQRAHDISGGRYTGMGILECEDIHTWVDFIKSNCEFQPRVLIYGMSMGAATTAFSLEKLDAEIVKCAVMDCGFRSPEEQMRTDARKWHIPSPLLMPIIKRLAKWRIGVDLSRSTSESLSKSAVPAMIIHGTGDRSVPIEIGRYNYEVCACPKQCIFVEGADHILSFMTMLSEEGQQLDTFWSFVSGYMEDK